jgi:4,5-DOPA dioxygenase extradiol
MIQATIYAQINQSHRQSARMRTAALQPSLFISHGAPDILLSQQEAVSALRETAARLAVPRAVVVVSAHWIDDPVGITAGGDLPTIHDFGGFPAPLYEMKYPARGDERLTSDITRLLHNYGIASQLAEQRGLDHGAWIPLMIMYPDARIPVVQVSLPTQSFKALVRLGAALRPLRDQGVLVIGSGGSVHNLRALKRDNDTDDWAVQFEKWLLEAVEGNHFERLITPSGLPETFRQAHPSLEHYAPLIVAWAAGDENQPGRRIHHSFTYGNLGMSCFEFGSTL